MSYAIYRMEKLKTGGAIAASSQHMMRTRPTPNADPSRAHLNAVLVGTSDPAADVDALLPRIGERTASGRLRRRQDSVLAIEVLLATSPEWWQQSTADQESAWVARSREWLETEYGAANIAHLQLHRDETSPHLTGFIVPRDPDQDGILNAKRWVGKRDRLRAQQTSYAAAVEDLGLRRGREGSTAKHERVKRVYGAVDAVADVWVETPPRFGRKRWAADVNRRLEPLRARAARADAAESGAKAARAEARKERGRADRNETFRAQADRLRSIPLPDVLDALCLVRSERDPSVWTADGIEIGVKDSKWRNHQEESGGSGAIDLVTHVLGRDFKAAVSWLAHAFGHDAAVRTYAADMADEAPQAVARYAADVSPFEPPEPVPENWPLVRTCLKTELGIGDRVTSRLRDGGFVYADRHGNAVFPMRDDAGAVVGAELAGTRSRRDGTLFTGLALGSSRDTGAVSVGPPEASSLYLVESAIDAVSLFILKAKKERDFGVRSTAGATGRLFPWMRRRKEAGRRLICAFGNDPAGDKAGQSLRAAGISRLRPHNRDWHAELRAGIRDRAARGAAERPQAESGRVADRPPRGRPDDDAGPSF